MQYYYTANDLKVLWQRVSEVASGTSKLLIEGSKAKRIAGKLFVIDDGNGWSTTRSFLGLPKN